MLLVTLAHKTLLSISQNRISPITLNKQLGNHLNMDIINASSYIGQGTLTEGEGSVQLTSLYSFRSDTFDNENIISFLTKQAG